MILAALPLLATISLAAPRTFPSGTLGYSVITADLNRDGVSDCVVYGSGLSVLLGKADGTLGAPTRIQLTSADSAAVADFNGDGLLDLASAFSEFIDSGQIVVYLGRGDGTFRDPITTKTTKPLAGIAVADLDGDGKLDVAAGNTSKGTIAVLNGQGDGTFRTPVYYEGNHQPWDIKAGDFDHDGHPDLAVLTLTPDGTQGTIDLFRNAGNGTMQKAQTITSLAGSYLQGLRSADFDGDGIPDLAIGVHGAKAATLLLARRDGTFDTRELPLSDAYIDLTSADVDGNGTPDLIVRESGDASFYEIFVNDGAAFFRRVARYYASGATGVAVADLDCDGKLELITARPVSGSASASTIAVMRGLGDAKFVSVPVIPGDFKTVPAGQPRGHAVAAADVTGDGKPDLIATNNNDTFSVFAGKGDSTFGTPRSYNLTGRSVVGAADFNGDGKPDLFFGQSASASVLINRGNADFDSPVVLSFSTLYDIGAADLNGDGRSDLIVTALDAVHVAVAKQDGTFQPDAKLPVAIGHGLYLGNSGRRW